MSPHNSPRAPYATFWENSRGRDFGETKNEDRTPYQRDRDRVIHSEAFRRLQGKMQVIANFEEGNFRSRLTHSLEVAQLTRTMCRSLELDEDLGEVVALSHDLGHPPFGHTGEEALAECMEKLGGFDHNLQAMRILRQLEIRYGHCDGLNLTWETLEGIAKHNGPMVKGTKYYKTAKDPLIADLEPQTWCGLEAQVAALADDMAYNHHDIEDGLATGILYLEQILEVPQIARVWQEVTSMFPKVEYERQVKEMIRRLIARQVKDLLRTSRESIKLSGVISADEVRAHDKALIRFSDEVETENRILKNFMKENMYLHYKMNRSRFKARKMVTDLFEAFYAHRRTLPPLAQKLLPIDKTDELGKARVVCNYIASLTDQQAVLEHSRLYGTRNQL